MVSLDALNTHSRVNAEKATLRSATTSIKYGGVENRKPKKPFYLWLLCGSANKPENAVKTKRIFVSRIFFFVEFQSCIITMIYAQLIWRLTLTVI